VLPVYTARVSGNYGPVTAVTSDVGASYHALTIAERRRAAGARVPRGLDVVEGDRPGPEHGRDTEAELTARSVHGAVRQGAVAAELPHKFVASAVWEPRVRTTEPWLRHVANGRTISSIFYETSGRPHSYEIFGGTRLAGGRESSNRSGGAVYLPR
jgi:hypothetical protein